MGLFLRVVSEAYPFIVLFGLLSAWVSSPHFRDPTELTVEDARPLSNNEEKPKRRNT